MLVILTRSLVILNLLSCTLKNSLLIIHVSIAKAMSLSQHEKHTKKIFVSLFAMSKLFKIHLKL